MGQHSNAAPPIYTSHAAAPCIFMYLRYHLYHHCHPLLPEDPYLTQAYHPLYLCNLFITTISSSANRCEHTSGRHGHTSAAVATHPAAVATHLAAVATHPATMTAQLGDVARAPQHFNSNKLVPLLLLSPNTEICLSYMGTHISCEVGTAIVLWRRGDGPVVGVQEAAWATYCRTTGLETVLV